MQEFKELLKNKKFTYVWASQMLSQFTINIMNFLLLTRIFKVTGSTVATSFLWVSFAIPAIIIGPVGAAVADFIDKRKVLIVTNLLQALVIFLYAYLHESKFFLLFGVAFAYSLLNQFYVPAESASIPTLVNKKLLAYANSLFFLTQQIAIIVGFGMAGVFAQLLGFTYSLYLCSLLVFLAFVSTCFLPKLVSEEKITNVEEAFGRFFSGMIEGYHLIKENGKILTPFILLLAIQVALSVATVNLPIFAKEILQVNVNAVGSLVVIPAGIGAAIAGFLVPRLLHKKKMRKRTIIETSLIAAGVLLLIVGFIIPQLGTIARVVLGFITTVFCGMAFVGIQIPAQTYLQEVTPGGFRGRVFGNFWFIATIITILPVIFSGAITEVLGLKTLVLVMGVLVLAGFILFRNVGEKLLNGKVVVNE